MKRCMVAMVVLALVLLVGCGNVYLSGDGLSAAQQSTMDAYQAVQRADTDPATPPTLKIYLTQNFKQWRFFVRSAVKDLNWGPKLPGESTTQPAVP